MTLDEAIKHCEEKAANACNKKCGEDHARLSVWLKKLRYLKKQHCEEFWVARDGNRPNGSLYLSKEKPVRHGNVRVFECDGLSSMLPDEMFPEVTWENSPQKVELRLIGR
jgi:hypothetical protein